jgi:hypothetical protein
VGHESNAKPASSMSCHTHLQSLFDNDHTSERPPTYENMDALRQDSGYLHDSRLEDYLNDRLQTLADLEDVDRLLLRAKEQQKLLKEQVRIESLNPRASMELTCFSSLQKLRSLYKMLLRSPSDMNKPFESKPNGSTNSKEISIDAFS